MVYRAKVLKPQTPSRPRAPPKNIELQTLQSQISLPITGLEYVRTS